MKEEKVMKKIPIFLIALFLVSLGSLSGCTDFEKDLGEALEGEVVAVSVYAYADVINSTEISLDILQVQFDFIKSGGDDFQHIVDVGQDGRALCPYVGYNLHEGEYIYVTASIAGVPGGGDSATLTFSSAKNNAQKVGNNSWTYQWEPAFNLIA